MAATTRQSKPQTHHGKPKSVVAVMRSNLEAKGSTECYCDTPMAQAHGLLASTPRAHRSGSYQGSTSVLRLRLPDGDVTAEEVQALSIDVTSSIQIPVVDRSAGAQPSTIGQGECCIESTTGRTQPARRIEAPNHHEIGVAP